MRPALLFALLFFIHQPSSWTQNELSGWTEIGAEEGLSDRTIKDIIRDHSGYIWIGTRNGLNRYDGLNVVSYTNDPNSATRINGKDIKAIAARQSGSILIQYEANRSFIDVLHQNNTIAQRIFFNEENGVPGVVEYVELNDKYGEVHLLVSIDSALAVVRLNEALTFDTQVTFNDYSKRASSTYQMLTDQRRSYWINDDKVGLLNFGADGDWLSTITYDTLGLSPSAGSVEIFHRDKLGRFWLTFENARGLWEYNEAASLFKPVLGDTSSTLVNFYPGLWEDAQGNVIILERNAQQAQQLKLHLIRSDDAWTSYSDILIETPSINTMYSQDFERLIFIGTNSGLKKVNLTKKHVRTLVASENPRDWAVSLRGITSPVIGQIFFSREKDTWYQYDLDQNQVSTIDIDHQYSNDTEFLASSKELLTDHNGNVWGCRYSTDYGGQLLMYNPIDSSFEYYGHPSRIQSMIIGQDSNIWLVAGTEEIESRLIKFDLKHKTFHNHLNDDNTNPLKDVQPTFLYQALSGVYWIGSTSGLICVDPRETHHTKYKFSPDNYYGLRSDLINCIAEDRTGDIWIGTDQGVSIYNVQDESFSFYDVSDGLVSNHVMGIIEDDKGNFWFSTRDGLSYFDREQTSFRNFDVSDGLSSNHFNRFSFHKDSLGNIYFGGVNGLNMFNPNELLERDLDAPILLSEMSYYDKEEDAIVQHLHNLQGLKEVRLAASNRYFRCRFAMADYAYPEENRFMYQLEGRDVEWTQIGSQTELTFNNLAAGDYILRIVGVDRNLNQSSATFEMPIKVEEYFYRKSWFLAGCIFFVLLAIYLFHRIKLQQAINMERLRTKISSDLHDDVGGVLSGLAMQTELLEYSAKEQDKPKLKRISDMSRNAMAQMRDVIWATDARKDKFDDLLIRMKEFAAEMLFPKRIQCTFQVANIYTDKKIPVQVRQNLYLIFKEAITNVAKHSNASKVAVSFSKEGSRFSMSIRDDGTHRPDNGTPISSLNGIRSEEYENASTDHPR